MSERSKGIDLEADTRQVVTYDRMSAAAPRVPALTIVFHPELARIGERSRLKALDRKSARVTISRLEPAFEPPFQPEAGLPLATSFVSRRPIVIGAEHDGSFTFDVRESGTALVVDGVAIEESLNVSVERLEEGVVLELAGQVVLLFHLLADQKEPGDLQGLVGQSDSITQVRKQILRVAKVNAPVLVRGETGTGKELVAQAVHYASERKDKPYLTVNMAAIPSSLASSELFGHTRGAFSGARGSSEGFFGRADGGTLFLDEVGDTPTEVQAALLRVLETGEVQQLGAEKMRTVDVRLVAATDADIEKDVEAGRFRAPLFYRLANQEIRLPPLRERRDDIGRLLSFFLRGEFHAQGRLAEYADKNAEGMSWLPAAVVARLARYDWPGNVRQLRNVARFIASIEPGDPMSAEDPQLNRLMPVSRPGVDTVDIDLSELRGSRPAAPPKPKAGPKRSPSEIGEDEIEKVLAEHDFKLGPTAAALGISRPALNELVDAHPTVTRANNLSVEDISEASDKSGGDLDIMWRKLQVSKRGLKLRMKELDLL